MQFGLYKLQPAFFALLNKNSTFIEHRFLESKVLLVSKVPKNFARNITSSSDAQYFQRLANSLRSDNAHLDLKTFCASRRDVMRD